MPVLGVAIDWLGPAPDLDTRVILAPAAAWKHTLVAHLSAGCGAFGHAQTAGPRANDLARNGDLVVAADARIDNLADLTVTLDQPPDAPLTDVIMAGYRHWGENLASHLIGDFTIVVWDVARRHLYAARDPFGVRPLYYAQRPNRLWIASDPAQLLALPAVSRTIDDDSVVDHLRWDYRFRDRTFFADIRKIPPGHALIATAQGAQVRCHWFAPAEDPALADPDVLREAFTATFRCAVSDRLRSNRPIVMHLSGGLDSSSIVLMADQLARHDPAGYPRLVAVSARYPGLACDEGPYIDAVRDRIVLPALEWQGSLPHLLDLKQPDPIGPGQRSCWSDGSDGDRTIAIEADAGVILDGTGGDEIGRFPGVMRDLGARHDWRGIAGQVLAQETLTVRQRFRRLKNAVRGVGGGSPAIVRKLLQIKRDLTQSHDIPAWVAPHARQLFARVNPPPVDAEMPFASHAQKDCWRLFVSPRLGAALDLAQHHAITRGIEIRCPFLDARLARLVLAIPHAYRKHHRDYRLHQRFLGDLMPPVLTNRRTKATFGSAVANQVIAAQSEARILLFDGHWASEKFVARDVAARAFLRTDVNSDRVSEVDEWKHWNSLWRILTLEAWLRRHRG